MTGGTTISGRCLCGAVQLTAAAASAEVSACHCDMCRRWASGPYLVVEADGGIEIAGGEHLTVYRSSEWGERAFCARCGSALYWHESGSDSYAVSAGLLDDQSQLKLTTEIFTEDQPAYYAFSNHTKRLTGEEAMAAVALEQKGT